MFPYSLHSPWLFQISASLQVWTSGRVLDKQSLLPCFLFIPLLSCPHSRLPTDPSLRMMAPGAFWLWKSKNTFLYHSVTVDTAYHFVPLGFSDSLGFPPISEAVPFLSLSGSISSTRRLKMKSYLDLSLGNPFFFPSLANNFSHSTFKVILDSWFSNFCGCKLHPEKGWKPPIILSLLLEFLLL